MKNAQTSYKLIGYSLLVIILLVAIGLVYLYFFDTSRCSSDFMSPKCREHFGSQSPSNFLPDTCASSIGISCNGSAFSLGTDSAQISLINQNNEGIYLLALSYKTQDMSSFEPCLESIPMQGDRSNAPFISNKESATIVCTWQDDVLSSGSKSRVNFEYRLCFESDAECVHTSAKSIQVIATVLEN